MNRLTLSLLTILLFSCSSIAVAQKAEVRYRDPRQRESRDDFFRTRHFNPYLEFIQEPGARYASRYHRQVQEKAAERQARQQPQRELDRPQAGRQGNRRPQTELPRPPRIQSRVGSLPRSGSGFRSTGHTVTFGGR